MQLPFSKYSGCGNDFILIDNRQPLISSLSGDFFRKICHRQLGIGADGVILLENSQSADFKMRIFNADGSEAEMCGNGIRCLFQFLLHQGEPKRKYQIETMHDLLEGSYESEGICIQMPLSNAMRWHIPLPLGNQLLTAHFLNTGVPHAVIFVPDVEQIAVESLGPQIRHHPLFSPHGTNVNWVEICPDQGLKIRTYERGVESETLACGTGSTAAALAAHFLFQLPSPIRVQTRSQETLEVGFSFLDGEFHDVKMSGPARFVFDGIFHMNDFISNNQGIKCQIEALTCASNASQSIDSQSNKWTCDSNNAGPKLQILSFATPLE